MIQEKGQLHMYRTQIQMQRRVVLEQDGVADIKTYMRKADGGWAGRSMKVM